MKKIVSGFVLTGLLLSSSVAQAMDWKDLIAVWLITKCVVYVCCDKYECCSCVKKRKNAEQQLKLFVEALKKELEKNNFEKNVVRIKLVSNP